MTPLNQLTSGPLGSYAYGDSAHLHAATQVDSGGSAYTASYDASGNMVCRAPDGSTTCTGDTTTGQHLSYDNEGRLTSWQNAPSSPTSTDQYLYDGEGNRVEQQTMKSGTTTTTVYIGDIESVATTGARPPPRPITTPMGSGSPSRSMARFSYLASDLLGSATVALNSSGTPTASQLYAPYGGTRYSNGTMPTDYGFTGQRADSATGLDYYSARYYDPTLGQFTSADTVLDGLNRYGYVGGNPISNTDPSGHEDFALQRDSFGGDLSGEGSGGELTGLANAILQLIFGTTVAAAAVTSHHASTTTATTLAGTPDPTMTFAVNGATIVVTSTGDLVVTQGATTTDYAAGSAGWQTWSHAIDGAYANTDVWNARTAPGATTGTTTTTLTPVHVVATEAGDAGAASGEGSVPVNGSGAAAAGGGSEPPGGDDPCTCSGASSGRPAIRVGDLQPIHTPETAGVRPDLEGLTDDELLQSVSNPTNNDPLKINTRTGGVMDGNGRAYELLRRAGDPNSTITPDTRVPYEPYVPFTPWDSDLC